MFFPVIIINYLGDVVRKINISELTEFYDSISNVWPEDDHWHLYSKNKINKFVSKCKINKDAYILNAGSGGSTYNLKNRMHHVDISSSKISLFNEYTVSTIEMLPFDDHTFDTIICVGSVLNYSDAFEAIAEMNRVLKKNGILILEFESSFGFEHRFETHYKSDASIIKTSYDHKQHSQWIYSPKYILNILKQKKIKIQKLNRFHYASGLNYSKHKDENRAAKFTKFDFIFKILPFINKKSNNIIIKGKKL